MNDPFVSIMIPTYNQARYLGKTIESCLEQDYPNLEVVVSDDASTDETAEVVGKYLGDVRLKYVRNEKNVGRVGNYRSLLFNHARGDWVLNVDGDDYLCSPGFISESMEIVKDNAGLVAVYANQFDYYEWDGSFSRKTPDRMAEGVHGGGEILWGVALGKVGLYHLTTLYDARLARDIDFYSKDIISSDWESLYRLLSLGKVYKLNRHVGVWRHHGANETAKLHVGALLENGILYSSVYSFARRNCFRYAVFWYLLCMVGYSWKLIKLSIIRRDARLLVKIVHEQLAAILRSIVRG